jgi:hypothetical protein
MESSTPPVGRFALLTTFQPLSPTDPATFVARCREFEPTGEHDQRQRYRFPKDILHGVEALAMACGEHRRPKSRQATLLFCVAEGLPRVRALPGVAAIKAARDVAIECGSLDASWFDEFRFEVDTRHLGHRDFNARKIDEWISTETAKLSDDLGLSGNTVAVLAVATALLDAPASHVLKTRLATLVHDFANQLARRATRAREIATEAVQQRSGPSPITFEGVMQDIDAGS